MIVALVGLKPRKAMRHWTAIQISWDCYLDIVSVDSDDAILHSFTDFITTPEISGPLYISPDVYHPQITEHSPETIYRHINNRRALFCLDRIYLNCNYNFYLGLLHRVLRLDCSFKDHTSRALLTEMIFYILRSLTASSSWGLVPLDVVDLLGNG